MVSKKNQELAKRGMAGTLPPKGDTLIRKTEPPPDQTQDKAPADPIRTSGLGLRMSEWAELDRIADEVGTKPHALIVYAIRIFIDAYKQGKQPTAREVFQLTHPGRSK